MKFSEIMYKRPDFELIINGLNSLFEQFDLADSAEKQYEIYKSANDLFIDVDTQFAMVRIRNSIDTTDEFYKNERLIFTEKYPLLSGKYKQITRALLRSKFRSELEEKIGKIHFSRMELSTKISSAETLEDRREESKLTLKYSNLCANLSANFDGKDLSVSELMSYRESLDAHVRKAAYIAEGDCYNSVKAEFDDIFDELVQNRAKQADKLGYNNYTELAYAIMGRISYDVNDIAKVKNFVKKEIVPLVTKIKENRRKRLGADNLTICDSAITFVDGAPKLCVHDDEIMKKGVKMYGEMSEITGEFIEIITKNELYDIKAKKGKAFGGFCSYLQKYNYPFIFANFNGTSTDAYIVFHEAGHALARYITRKKHGNGENASYPMDISECHSMTMELLTMPWYHLFFGEDTQKYKLTHVENALIFIPYACMVDEFQEQIYKNPNLTPSERDKLWLEIEKDYRPEMDYDDVPFYKDGAGWQRQQHIYRNPFYYIEYCLAQIVAFQFFAKSLDNYDETLKKYFEFIEYGGSKTLTELCDCAGISSPFEEEAYKIIQSTVVDWINNIII